MKTLNGAVMRLYLQNIKKYRSEDTPEEKLKNYTAVPKS